MIRDFVALAVLVGLTALGAAAALQTSAPPVRVAIRVDASAAPLVAAVALDVWSERTAPRQPIDVVVTEDVADALVRAGVRVEILSPDIDADARAEAARIFVHQPADWFAEYHDYRDIVRHLGELAEFAPDRVSLAPIGASID